MTKTKTVSIVGHGAKFAAKLHQAIAALMSEPSIERAAHVVGITGNTLLRWMKEPQFATAYADARHAAFSQSIARLQDASSLAVAALCEILTDKKAPLGLKIRAADIVLAHGERGSGEKTAGRPLGASDSVARAARLSSKLLV